MTYIKKHQQTNKDKKTFLTNMIKKISNNWHPSLKKHFLKKTTTTINENSNSLFDS